MPLVMLYIIGTGLNNYKDISLRAFEVLKNCDIIYQECYTCIQADDITKIEELIGKNIIMANRKLVEETYQIIEESMNKDIAFLVAGTPMFATTHTDLLLRAKEKNVSVSIIHNTSIASVKGCYGLYSYNFGRTISIPYFTETWKPTSFIDNIYKNYKNGMHTLCLLDIKTDENRFMSVNEAIEELLYADKSCKYVFFTENTKLFAICRFSTDDELVVYDTASNLLKMSFGKPLHSLIIPAPLSVLEKEFIEEMFSKKN